MDKPIVLYFVTFVVWIVLLISAHIDSLEINQDNFRLAIYTFDVDIKEPFIT